MSPNQAVGFNEEQQFGQVLLRKLLAAFLCKASNSVNPYYNNNELWPYVP